MFTTLPPGTRFPANGLSRGPTVDIPKCRTLRLILGDQLNQQHSWFEKPEPETLYLIAELPQEASYVRHHVQKVLAFFSAMRQFARQLEDSGHRVLWLDLDDSSDYETPTELLAYVLRQSEARRFEYQRPDEYRLVEQLREFCKSLELESECVDSEHFLVPFDQLNEYFQSDKQARMEHFYRRIRRETGWLMTDQGKPEGGQWNYDVKNRKSMPKRVSPPPPLLFENKVDEARQRIEKHEIETLGTLSTETLSWPVDRAQSLKLVDYFIEHQLECFGDYQDALTARGWALFHSRLSFAINSKLISPREVVTQVLDAWRSQPDRYPLSSVEGFVRQIIGWREFMRGIYWTRMPEYEQLNELDHHAPLPAWYWTGDTRMACLAQAIGQSLEHAYAHHIQRLMVTGNFALLAGVDPDEVDAWYLGIYVDALQWVELPNTRGMSQFADGGVVASKPYVSSGNYINKMGDHCRSCFYDVKQKTGPKACPFNALYWNFMDRHRERLERNPRIGMVYRSWDRMEPERQQALLEQAKYLLEHVDQL